MGALSRLRTTPALAALLVEGIADLLGIGVSYVRIVEATNAVYGSFIFPATAAPMAAAASPGGHLRALQLAVPAVSDVVVIGVFAISAQATASTGSAHYAGFSQEEIATNMRTILVSAFGASSAAPKELAPFAAAWGAGAPSLLAVRMPSMPLQLAAAARGADASWYPSPLSAFLLGLGAAALVALAVLVSLARARLVTCWTRRVADHVGGEAASIRNPKVLVLRTPVQHSLGDPARCD